MIYSTAIQDSDWSQRAPHVIKGNIPQFGLTGHYPPRATFFLDWHLGKSRWRFTVKLLRPAVKSRTLFCILAWPCTLWLHITALLSKQPLGSECDCFAACREKLRLFLTHPPTTLLITGVWFAALILTGLGIEARHEKEVSHLLWTKRERRRG